MNTVPKADEALGQQWGDKGCVHDLSKCSHDENDGCEYCCMTCNTDTHLCLGCGTISDHNETPCDDECAWLASLPFLEWLPEWNKKIARDQEKRKAL